MNHPVDALVLDLLEWVGPSPRPYVEVMEAWRTSCPRLPVWEDANERGFVERQYEPGRGAVVVLTPPDCGTFSSIAPA
jgi:D-3-phosphoglycerate dehydrogenase